MDATSPLVTVILPTFNRRTFLPAAIQSIVDQRFPAWRLLVVNDGGEDVSDVVESFGDPRIEWHDRPHLGKAAALNHGLALVASKYVAYMDDDDIVYPDHLAELVGLAEREKADFVYSDSWTVWLDPQGGEIRRRVENREDASVEDLLYFNRINHKQILHAKRLSDEAGPYDERLRILIDYDYIRRLARLSPPVHLRKTTGEHFLRQASDRPRDYASISGLWVSDPGACAQSLFALFEKDPPALAALYRDALRNRNRLAVLEPQVQSLRESRDKLKESRDKLRASRDRLKEHRDDLLARLQAIETSPSFRFSRALAFLLGWPLSLLRACRPRRPRKPSP